jgi:hypothetical protein
MVRCKKGFGAPDDDERRPPHLTTREKNKGTKKTVTKKKRKCGDVDAETVAVVAAAAECVERGVGVHIGDHLTVA